MDSSNDITKNSISVMLNLTNKTPSFLFKEILDNKIKTKINALILIKYNAIAKLLKSGCHVLGASVNY